MRRFAVKWIALMALFCIPALDTLASQVSGTIIVEKNIRKQPVVAITYDLRGAAVPDASSDKQGSSFEGLAVWLDSDTAAPAAPITATMQQRNRQLEPGLLVLSVGSTVNFPNMDPIFHNIFSLSKAQTFDLGYYPKGNTRSVTFRHSGIIQVYCHVHPNMYGAIVVTSSRWFGKPAADGSFSWADVPPGRYRLMVWQKFAGLFPRDIVVPEAGNVNVRIAIPEEQESR